jgi:hypothetical protein
MEKGTMLEIESLTSPPSAHGEEQDPPNFIVVKLHALIPNPMHRNLLLVLVGISLVVIVIVVPPFVWICVLIGSMYGIYHMLAYKHMRLIAPFIKKKKKHPVTLVFYTVFFLSFFAMMKERYLPRKASTVGIYDFMFYNCLGSYVITMCSCWFLELATLLPSLLAAKCGKRWPLGGPGDDAPAEEKLLYARKKGAAAWVLIAVGMIQSAVLNYADPAVVKRTLNPNQ